MQENNRIPGAIEKFLLHIHPQNIDERAISYTKTFGLGGICALLFILLIVSGVLLRFTYIPTPEKAYNSVLFLINDITFGRLLRNIHHFSANLLVITSFLHLIRVYYTQSIYKERAKNWIYGLVLMFLVLFFSFTGYLLPWDQLAYWAVTIMTGMLEYIPVIGMPLANMFRGGAQVNGTTLINFYNLHTGVLPIFLIFFMSMHFWLVRKAKGITLPKSENKKVVAVFPNLISKEILVGLIVLVFVFGISIFFNAPLLDKASTTISPNPSKAPWYFMGVQELLLHVHPVIAVFVVPVITLTFFVLLPYLNYENVNQGIWFNSAKGKNTTIISIVFALTLTLLVIIISEFVLANMLAKGVSIVLSVGILPLVLFLIPLGGFQWYLFKIKNAKKIEIIMSLVTIVLTSYIVMMIIGVWFRGEGMSLGL